MDAVNTVEQRIERIERVLGISARAEQPAAVPARRPVNRVAYRQAMAQSLEDRGRALREYMSIYDVPTD